MVKFPSQRKINFESGNTADGSITQIGNVNLPYALSVLNRRGYASTTRKGVPLIFKTKVDYYRCDEDGLVAANATGGDLLSTLIIDGCQNNWVMRNAAVKYHAAREEMFRAQGIRKGDRGAYSHEIRYNYDGADDVWMEPKDAAGNDFTGGTWDASHLSYAGKGAFELSLVGTGDDEESDQFAGSVLSIGHSYLVSRLNQQADTNLAAEEGPAKFSVLNQMLNESKHMVAGNATFQDEVIAEARNAQDNPPYEVLDLSASGDTAHDITKEVELGRAVAGIGDSVGSVIVEIPFGICQLSTYFEDAGATDTTLRSFISMEVLDIFEMQG